MALAGILRVLSHGLMFQDEAARSRGGRAATARGLWRRFQERPPVGRSMLAVPVVVVALLVLGALVVWVASGPLLRPSPTAVVQSATPPTAQGGAPPPKPADPGNPSSPPAAAHPATSPAVADRPTVVVPSPSSLAPSPTPSPSPSPESPPAVSAKVVNTDGQGANMRRTASVSAQRVKLLPEGTIVELLGPEVRGDGYGWRNVRDADGAAGFVIVDYLHPIQGPPSATPVLPPPQITIDEITATVARGDDATLAITTPAGRALRATGSTTARRRCPKEARSENVRR